MTAKGRPRLRPGVPFPGRFAQKHLTRQKAIETFCAKKINSQSVANMASNIFSLLSSGCGSNLLSKISATRSNCLLPIL